jgi:hypothetical protein
LCRCGRARLVGYPSHSGRGKRPRCRRFASPWGVLDRQASNRPPAGAIPPGTSTVGAKRKSAMDEAVQRASSGHRERERQPPIRRTRSVFRLSPTPVVKGRNPGLEPVSGRACPLTTYQSSRLPLTAEGSTQILATAHTEADV